MRFVLHFAPLHLPLSFWARPHQQHFVCRLAKTLIDSSWPKENAEWEWLVYQLISQWIYGTRGADRLWHLWFVSQFSRPQRARTLAISLAPSVTHTGSANTPSHMHSNIPKRIVKYPLSFIDVDWRRRWWWWWWFPAHWTVNNCVVETRICCIPCGCDAAIHVVYLSSTQIPNLPTLDVNVIKSIWNPLPFPPKQNKNHTKTKLCKTQLASPQESLVAAAADQADDPSPNLNMNTNTNTITNPSANQLNVPNAKFRQKTPFMHRIAQLGIQINSIIRISMCHIRTSNININILINTRIVCARYSIEMRLTLWFCSYFVFDCCAFDPPN